MLLTALVVLVSFPVTILQIACVLCSLWVARACLPSPFHATTHLHHDVASQRSREEARGLRARIEVLQHESGVLVAERDRLRVALAAAAPSQVPSSRAGCPGHIVPAKLGGLPPWGLG